MQEYHRDLSTILNWALTIVVGCVLAYFYTILSGLLSVYFADIPVRNFTAVTDKQGKLYLLYFGSLITGSMAAILTAIFTVYILGLFFRGWSHRFGILTGIIGVSLLAGIFVLNTDSFSDLFAQASGFLFVDILNWLVLIVFCGIASLLGHKSREKFLKFYKGSS